MLAYYLHDLSPFIVRFSNGAGLHWYGLAYVLSFSRRYWLYHWLSAHRYNDIPPARGGRFHHLGRGLRRDDRRPAGRVIFYSWRQTVADPLSAFRVWEGGMASHGGILGLVLFTLYYVAPASALLDEHRR